MVNKPRWLTLAATGVIAVLVLLACTPAAGPTTAPTTAPTSTARYNRRRRRKPPASDTGRAAGEAPAALLPSDAAECSGRGDRQRPRRASPGHAVSGNGRAAASDPASITDAYPNYGGAVDCEAGTFNGLPYAGNVEVDHRSGREHGRLRPLQPGRGVPVEDRVLGLRDQRQRLPHRRTPQPAT